MLGTARLKLIKQFLLCFVAFLKIDGWVDVFATELHRIHHTFMNIRVKFIS